MEAGGARPLGAGTELGPFVLGKMLGTGGMGTVYAADVVGRAPGLDAGARVAVKVVHPHMMETPGFFKRFLREADIGKTVQHENVVRTYDADALVADGQQRHFLVMEYVEGQTLRELLAELDRVPEELCRHVGREIAKGLAAIHEAGVVHRDIKPENVLITAEHVVKVMDLGVARLQDEAVRLSQTGSFVGSLHYAAPEQFRHGGAHVDQRADLHALGLVLYELGCGRHPFEHTDMRRVMYAVVNDVPRRVAEINPQLSAFYEEVVHKLLAKDPAERLQTAVALSNALDGGEASSWWAAHARALRIETRQPLRRIHIPRETALYGREDELDRLRSLFDRAAAGDGQMVLVEGEAGIGKSRLVDELVGRLRRDGEDLNFLFGSYPPGGAATAAGAFSTAYREQFGAAALAEVLHDYLAETPLLIPAFAALLRGDAAPKDEEQLNKSSLQTVFVHATRALAKERTTIVLIDDLHFAPEDGRALFAALSLALPGHRVLLVGTMRPGVFSEEWVSEVERGDHASRLALPRLGPKDLVGLLEDTFGSKRLAEELSAKIAVKSDGNPFFVFEMIQGLREGGFITQSGDGSWVSTGVIDEIAAPSSIIDLVNARVARLEERERDLLDLASCCGFDFDPALLAEVVGEGRIPILKALAHIERAHRLVRSVGRRFVFDHHQVQEGLYGRLPEMLREEYHAGIAAALESREGAADLALDELDGALAVELCEHFFRGAAWKRGLRYLVPALDHLAAGYLNDSAIDLADQALARPGLVGGEQRVELLVRKAIRLGHLGRQDAAGSALEEARAIEHSGAGAPTGKVGRALGSHLRDTGRFEDALDALQEAQEQAEKCGDTMTLANALNDRGGALYFAGRTDEAVEHCERAAALFDGIGDKKGLARTYGGLGLINWQLGRLDEAEACMRRQLALAREAGGGRGGEAPAVGNLGLVMHSRGRFEEARSQYEQYLAISREIGSREGEATAAGNFASLGSATGRLAEAREWGERYIEMSREIGYLVGVAHGLANLGNNASLEGRGDAAREVLTRSIQVATEIGAKRQLGIALMFLGLHDMQTGEIDVARENLTKALELARERREKETVIECLVALGALAHECGDTGTARAHLDEALELATTAQLGKKETAVRAHLARLPDGDVPAALAALSANESALGLIGGMEMRFLLFQATNDPVHLAEAHRRLVFVRDHASDDSRDTMVENVPLYRDIAAAWAAHGGTGD